MFCKRLEVSLANIIDKHSWQRSLASLALIQLNMRLSLEPQNSPVVIDLPWMFFIAQQIAFPNIKYSPETTLVLDLYL